MTQFMKTMIAIGAAAVGLVSAAGYFSKEAQGWIPFQTKTNRMLVSFTAPPDASQMTIKNESKIKLKVYVYNAQDAVRLVALGGWDLAPGETATCPRSDYRFKAVIPGLVDRVIAESKVIGSNVAIRGAREDNITFEGAPLKPVRFVNKTSEAVKICTYTDQDLVRAVPLNRPCLTLSPNRAADWQGAPGSFTVGVFRPQFMDKPLAMEPKVPAQAQVDITEPPPKGLIPKVVHWLFG